MFKAISIFATLAFAGFASARPIDAGEVTAPVGGVNAALPAIPRAEIPEVSGFDTSKVALPELPRRDVPVSVAVVFQTLVDTISPKVDELSKLFLLYSR